MKKVAILGGSRGILHANAYKHTNGFVSSVCDKNAERLFDATYNIYSKPKGYDDFEKMLDIERPDIVHIVTAPNIKRSSWFPILNKCDSIKLVVMEKPLALTPLELTEFRLAYQREDVKFKVVVNHQRRYFPAFICMRYLIQQGLLGNVYRVAITSYGEPMETGTHSFDIALMIRKELPETIIATCWGGTLKYNPLYRCPDNLSATLLYDDDLVITILIGLDEMFHNNPIGIREDRHDQYFYHYSNRMRAVITGTLGNFYWNEYGYWGYNIFGNKPISKRFLSDYIVDTPYAQALLATDNILACDADFELPCSYTNASLGLNLLFTCYHSAFIREPVEGGKPINEDGFIKLLGEMRT